LDTFQGPWAPVFEGEKILQSEPTEEQKEWAATHGKKKRGPKVEEELEEETSLFHGTQERDYQGRTYIHPPERSKRPMDLKCFIPKRLLHTWSGHTKGVSAIRFFPNSAHLLLSSSMDSIRTPEQY